MEVGTMNELTVTSSIQNHQFDWQFYLSNFLRTQNGKSYKTIKAYEGGIKSFFYWMKGEGIDKPLPDDIHDYLGYLREQRKSVFTIGLYMISLKLFFAYLNQPYVTEGTAPVQVYPDIYSMAAPKLQRPQRKVHYRDKPTNEEIVTLRKVVSRHGQQGVRDLLMIDLALYCGLRVNEIANVKAGDLVRDGETFKLFVLRKGKTRKNNFVWVDPDLARRLAAYAEKYKLEKYIFTDISHRGSKGHLCSSTVSDKINRYLKKAQIKRENLTAHSLRHYAGTAFYQATKDLYATQQFLGHSNSETTEIYMHVEDNYNKMSFSLAPVS